MLNHIPDHFSNKFKLDISKLPTHKTDRAPLEKAVLGIFFGLLMLFLGIFELITFIRTEETIGKSFLLLDFFALIIIAIAIGLIVNSILSITRYKKFYFDGKDFKILYRPSIGIKHKINESLDSYIGVRLRVLFTQDGLFNKNRYIIDLFHQDASKIVPLYISTNGKNIRKIWENYAREFKLPAISVSERGVIKRDYEDLNKSVKELAKEDKLPFIASGKFPAPSSLKIEETTKATSIEPIGIYWDTFSTLFLFIAVVFVFLLLAGGIYLTFTGTTLPVKYWIIGLLFLLLSAYLSTKLFSSYRINLSDDSITVYYLTGNIITKETQINTNMIENVELNYNTTIDRYDLTIISDDKIISFGSRLPANDLIWLRDFITRKLIGN